MTEQKRHENIFKFSVYLILEEKNGKLIKSKEPIVEKIFSADRWNPVIRYSVDIRQLLPDIMRRVKKVLSSRDLTYAYETYNFLEYYKEVSQFNNKGEKTKLSRPKLKKIACGLYINSNPIVERTFYVDKYNPESRFSIEIVNLINEIVEEIEHYLKNEDINHMLDDSEIIYIYGLNIQQVRELSESDRKLYLKKTDNLDFVRRKKMEIYPSNQ